MPTIPVSVEVVASVAREADETVVSTCSRLSVLPFDV
jgi:hypothetical protein